MKKVSIDKIQPGPIRHKTLPPHFRGCIEMIRDNCRELLDSDPDFWSVESFEDGFKRDLHPIQEMALWIAVSRFYREVVDSGLYPEGSELDIFALVLGGSTGAPIPFILDQTKLTVLTRDQAEGLLSLMCSIPAEGASA